MRGYALAGALIAQHDVAARQREAPCADLLGAHIHPHAQHRGDQELVAGRAHVRVIVLCAGQGQTVRPRAPLGRYGSYGGLFPQRMHLS